MDIQSSTIRSVKYEGSDMIIEFVNGRVYRYIGVPAETFAEFLGADSKGRFFHTRIKNCYGCVRIK